jgi:phospholipid/cholesterol/gamma-HCH transport system substrate-binding protein
VYTGAGKSVLMAAPRVFRTCHPAAVSLIAVGLVIACGSCAPQRQEQHAEYCAIMPDTVGLYVDNAVTQMGVRIGKVTAITPAARSIRVDFSVKKRSLPIDVKAVIRSASILADRSLELVGNYDSGLQLPAGGCIPLGSSRTPKSLSEVIGSAANFINAINPQGSTNVADVVKGIDQSLSNQGPNVNKLLTTTSAVLDSPDQAISDIGGITKNLAVMTSTLRALQPTLKETLVDAAQVAPDVAEIGMGTSYAFTGLPQLISTLADIERELGGELQQTLDSVSVVVRKLSARAPFYASLLNVAPRLIDGIANFVQTRGNSGFAAFNIRYRPPLYRVRTPDGAFQCGSMNAAMPGSCANVNGMPYAVDVALLQYVLTLAAKR